VLSLDNNRRRALCTLYIAERKKKLSLTFHRKLTIHLTPTADSTSTRCVLCRVTKIREEIKLELSREAIIIGLEVPIVVATTILMSGKNID
jgi:hypothetical protein